MQILLGLALLQKHKQSSVYANLVEAPDVHLQEAAVFHKFAEAAYTVNFLTLGICFHSSNHGIWLSVFRGHCSILEGILFFFLVPGSTVKVF